MNLSPDTVVARLEREVQIWANSTPLNPSIRLTDANIEHGNIVDELLEQARDWQMLIRLLLPERDAYKNSLDRILLSQLGIVNHGNIEFTEGINSRIGAKEPFTFEIYSHKGLLSLQRDERDITLIHPRDFLSLRVEKL